MIHSPFKFLDSYTKKDSKIFFGRETETEDLYRKIFENKTLLVYGVSGTGKTSIINCGLANKFNEADWLPVTIRRNQNMVESFYAALHKLSPDAKDKGMLDAKAFIKLLQSVYLDHFKPVYLLFDQFEELFIFGDEEEQEAFVDIIAEIKASDAQVKILFIMREEYLANMSAFEEKIPDLLTNRLRIEKMSTAKVKEAITGPCNFAGIEIENEAVEAIIEKLTRQGKTIELTYLQVLLDRLFHKATQEQKGDNLQFTQSLVASLGEVSDILGDFLEEQIRQFDNPDQVLDVLKSFVSIRGTKRQSTVEEIGNHLRSLNKAQEPETLQNTIQQLVNLRILREKDENDRYELRHDALAMKIYEKVTLVEKELLEVRDFLENALNNFQKRDRLLSVEDLKYIAPYEEKMFLSTDTAKLLERSKLELTRVKRRRRRITSVLATVFITVVVGFALWALNERNLANVEKEKAKASKFNYISKDLVSTDATKALYIAQQGYLIDSTNLQIKNNIYNILKNNSFYDLLNYYKPCNINSINVPNVYSPRVESDKTNKLLLVSNNLLNSTEILFYNLKGEVKNQMEIDGKGYYVTQIKDSLILVRRLGPGFQYKVFTYHGDKVADLSKATINDIEIKNSSILLIFNNNEYIINRGFNQLAIINSTGNIQKTINTKKTLSKDLFKLLDNNYLALYFNDSTIELVDSSFQYKANFPKGSKHHVLKGEMVAYNLNDYVFIESVNRKEKYKFQVDEKVRNITFLNSQIILVTTFNGKIYGLGIDGKELFVHKTGDVIMDILPLNNNEYISVHPDKLLQWELSNTKISKLFDLNVDKIEKLTSGKKLDKSLDGQFFAFTNLKNKVIITDKNFDTVRTFNSGLKYIDKLNFFDDRLIVSGDITTNIFSIKGDLIKSIVDSISHNPNVTFSKKGDNIFLTTLFQGIKIYDKDGNYKQNVHTRVLNPIIYSADSGFLHYRSKSKEIQLYDLDGKVLNTYCCLDSYLGGMLYSNYDNSIFAISDKALVKWNYNGKLQFKEEKHKSICHSILLNEPYKEIITISLNELFIWDYDGNLKDSYEFDFEVISVVTKDEDFIALTKDGSLLEIKRNEASTYDKLINDPFRLKEKVFYGLIEVDNITGIKNLKEAVELSDYVKESENNNLEKRKKINKLIERYLNQSNVKLEEELAFLKYFYLEKRDSLDLGFHKTASKVVTRIKDKSSIDINKSIIYLLSLYKDDILKNYSDEIFEHINYLALELIDRGEYDKDISENFLTGAFGSLFFKNYKDAQAFLQIAEKTKYNNPELNKYKPFVELFNEQSDEAIRTFKLWKDSTYVHNGSKKKYKDDYITLIKTLKSIGVNSEHFDEIEKVLQE